MTAAQVAILLLLCGWVYRRELDHMVRWAWRDPEWAHALCLPLLVGLLLWLRRRDLAAARGSGSIWGAGLLLGALCLYVGSSWPWDFAYPRFLSLVPAVAGLLLAVFGLGVLRRCVPILLLLAVAIPIPARQQADLVILPETMTLRAVAASLDLFPGIMADVQGQDLAYTGARSGTVALGEPQRGASLLLACLTVGIFVGAARVRPWPQTVVLVFAAGPIVLLCNYLRLLVFGLVTIVTSADPLDAGPRVLSTVLAPVLAWGLFAMATAAAAALLPAPAVEPAP